MIITIDTSALLAVLLNEEHKSGIIEATTGFDLQAPSSLDAEVGNALSAMFKRDRLGLKQARNILQQFREIPIRRTNLRLGKALQIAREQDIYAYGGYVLDCARQYRTPLLSLDHQMKNVAGTLNITLVEVPQ